MSRSNNVYEPTNPLFQLSPESKMGGHGRPRESPNQPRAFPSERRIYAVLQLVFFFFFLDSDPIFLFPLFESGGRPARDFYFPEIADLRSQSAIQTRAFYSAVFSFFSRLRSAPGLSASRGDSCRFRTKRRWRSDRAKTHLIKELCSAGFQKAADSRCCNGRGAVQANVTFEAAITAHKRGAASVDRHREREGERGREREEEGVSAVSAPPRSERERAAAAGEQGAPGTESESEKTLRR